MIISRTPLRISFVGGGSDIASYYRKHSGSVVSTAINKYIYIAVKHQFDGRIIVSYSEIETVRNVENIKNSIVREALKLANISGGLHITSIADIPSEGTGMGSSSSYAVGLLNALFAYKGKYVTAKRLAEMACKIEISLMKKPIGKQDQYAAAYGGLNYIKFNKDDTTEVDPIILLSEKRNALQRHLLLLYTGITRSADQILSIQSRNIKNNTNKSNSMKKMVQLSHKMRTMLQSNKIEGFGELLHENWKLKQSLADGISNLKIDQWYEKARRNGAIGGKLLGAGGGGFFLFYAPPEKHSKIIQSLPELVPLTFRFEQQGSKIIFIGD